LNCRFTNITMRLKSIT